MMNHAFLSKWRCLVQDEMRYHFKMSYRDLGAKLGVDHSHIHRVCTGKKIPGLSLFLRISEALYIELDVYVDY